MSDNGPPPMDPERRAELGARITVLGPGLLALFAAAHAAARLPEPAVARWAVLGATVAMVAGGIVSPGRFRLGRVIATASALAAVLLMAPALHRVPLFSLLLLSTLILLGATLWQTPRANLGSEAPTRAAVRASGAARSASQGSLAVGATVILLGLGAHSIAVASSLASFVLAWGYVGLWLARSPRARARYGAIFGAIAVATVAVGVLWWGRWPLVLAVSCGPALGAVLAPPRGHDEAWESFWEPVLGNPAQIMVLTFAALCVGGGLALALPQASRTGVPLALLDAMFTAVSATCVTGLIVVDTPVQFSALGQGVLVGLMQTGGIGIMTFSAAALLALGRRLSLRHEGAIASLVSAEDSRHLRHALARILLVAAASEAAGAALLALRFALRGEAVGLALWRGVFTAVSAFCNAGFALQSDNLVGLRHDHLVLGVVGTLVIVGGLSPAVVVTLPSLVRRRRVSLQAKLVLSSTAILLLGGAVTFAALEWTNTLGDLPLSERLHNAWFHSITPRTAGFNSLPMETMRAPTLALTMALMFIGGSPGSTAGGIKTVTAAVLALSVASTFRGRAMVGAFGRRIRHVMVYRAAAIATVSLVVVGAATTALLITQAAPASSLLFEVVSALGTVGLSVGATAKLDEIGKVLIMLCMFIGRVGPLTLFFFLTDRPREAPWLLPEEELEVG